MGDVKPHATRPSPRENSESFCRQDIDGNLIVTSNPNMSDQVTYFTCLLGQAALLQQSKPYDNIPAFIDYQAEHYPNLPALGCYDAGAHAWEHHVLTFASVQRFTRRVARHIQDVVNLQGQTIALLWPSSVEFLFIWLGLMYSDHPVLLVAPQCSASAIASLCQATEVSTIISHDNYSSLVRDTQAEAARNGNELKLLSLPPQAYALDSVDSAPSEPIHHANVTSMDVAYLHHTSGTSSGTPKPIPQTHHGGLVALPRLDGTETSTFTTTPLYHGGIADLLRAWTSSALIWLFPGADMPITASNVIRCLDIAETAHSEGEAPAIRYFSSVPYVLQMLAADDTGLHHLKRMQMVGVGGAALPPDVGDDLVQHGVRLVSRYGSAECGFLLSSHRSYETDEDWQYLRYDTAVDMFNFEEREDGLHELVVAKTWPHMAKRNREDGAYATSDLFERHPCIANAWRYHSRADSQLTLLTGKKFDPAPLEAAIAAGSSMIHDALIFGDGQAYPGVLLFRSHSAADVSDKEVKGQLRPLIQKLNAESQSHARIPLEMLVPMPTTTLEKSSKGTILRSIVTKRFSQEIEAAYAGSDKSLHSIPDSDLTATILRVVSSVMAINGGSLMPETDLDAYGLDSVASMQIRSKLTQFLPEKTKLPLTMVQDCGTVGHLAEYLLAVRQGKVPQTHRIARQEDVREQMRRMVKEHSVLPDSKEPQRPTQGANLNISNSSSTKDHTILLTGPTGTLGANLLHHLLTHAETLNIKHIYLLVRGSNAHASLTRVQKALTARLLSLPSNFTDNLVTVLPCKLSIPSLGLDADTYATLASQATHIYHLAWQVNFLQTLTTFTAHLASVRNLFHLSLACHRPPKFIFCSSTASASHATPPIPECLLSPDDPAAAGPTGYARSKWVAEQLCGFFAPYLTADKDISTDKATVDIVRVGQLAGSAATGCWARSEAYPLMLSASRALGIAPDLDAARGAVDAGKNEECAWVPVDVAATAFVELGFGTSTPPPPPPTPTSPPTALPLLRLDGKADSHDGVNGEPAEAARVWHLLPKPTAQHATWRDILTSILAADPGAFRVVPVREWLDALEALRESKSEHETVRDHPALQLVGFWRETYCGGGGDTRAGEGGCESEDGPARVSEGKTGQAQDQMRRDCDVDGQPNTTTSGCEMAGSVQAMPVLEARPAAVHLDAGYIAKCWSWIKENV